MNEEKRKKEYHEKFSDGYRIGFATVQYKSINRLFKKHFYEYYCKNKMYINWLSEYEVELILDTLGKNNQLNTLNKYLFNKNPDEDVY